MGISPWGVLVQGKCIEGDDFVESIGTWLSRPAFHQE